VVGIWGLVAVMSGALLTKGGVRADRGGKSSTSSAFNAERCDYEFVGPPIMSP